MDGALALINALRPRPHYAGGIWKRTFISTVKPAVHTNLSRQRSFMKALFRAEEFENIGFAFSCEWKTIETGALKNDDVTIITWFPCSSFPQTQIQNGRWLLRFQISPAECGRKTFCAFLGSKGVVKFLQRNADRKHFVRFWGQKAVVKFHPSFGRALKFVSKNNASSRVKPNDNWSRSTETEQLFKQSKYSMIKLSG